MSDNEQQSNQTKNTATPQFEPRRISDDMRVVMDRLNADIAISEQKVEHAKGIRAAHIRNCALGMGLPTDTPYDVPNAVFLVPTKPRNPSKPQKPESDSGSDLDSNNPEPPAS